MPVIIYCVKKRPRESVTRCVCRGGNLKVSDLGTMFGKWFGAWFGAWFAA